MPRSEAYVRAGEQWLLADDPAAAVHGFHRALADGGPSSVDPRIPLARALFQLGRAEEAEEHIRKLGSAAAPRCANVRSAGGIARRAVRPAGRAGLGDRGQSSCAWARPPVPWAVPANAADSGAASPAPREWRTAQGRSARADENELRLLLSLRFRIRNDLGLPEDDYDRLLDEQRLWRTGGR